MDNFCLKDFSFFFVLFWLFSVIHLLEAQSIVFQLQFKANKAVLTHIPTITFLRLTNQTYRELNFTYLSPHLVYRSKWLREKRNELSWYYDRT